MMEEYFKKEKIALEGTDINESRKFLVNFLEQLDKKEIPETYKDVMNHARICERYSFAYRTEYVMTEFSFRDKVIQRQGYTLVAKEWTRPLAKWIGDRKCVEVMAGKGALTHALKQDGVDIIATDDYSWMHCKSLDDIIRMPDLWEMPESMTAEEAIKGIDADIYIMGWPPMDKGAHRALMALKQYRPNSLIIVIGENYGGCTANDNFFDGAEELHDEEFNETVANKYTAWRGINDYIMLVK